MMHTLRALPSLLLIASACMATPGADLGLDPDAYNAAAGQAALEPRWGDRFEDRECEHGGCEDGDASSVALSATVVPMGAPIAGQPLQLGFHVHNAGAFPVAIVSEPWHSACLFEVWDEEDEKYEDFGFMGCSLRAVTCQPQPGDRLCDAREPAAVLEPGEALFHVEPLGLSEDLEPVTSATMELRTSLFLIAADASDRCGIIEHVRLEPEPLHLVFVAPD